MLNAVCGVVRPASGRVRIDGDDVTGSTPAVVVRHGVSQVPEGRHVFSTLPVEANLQLGAYGRFFSLEIVSSTLRYIRHKPEVRERLERVYTLFRSCGSSASDLPGARPAASNRWSRSGGH